MYVFKRVVSENKCLEITNITFDGDARSALDLCCFTYLICGPGSLVGIATDYGLDGP